MLGTDGWIKHSACQQWCGESRTVKRLRPGERWTGSLLDEAQGSKLTPNALEVSGHQRNVEWRSLSARDIAPKAKERQLLAPPASSNCREGGSSSSVSALPLPPAPPPLKPSPLAKRSLEQETELTDARKPKGQIQPSCNRESRRGARSSQKCLKPRAAAAAAAGAVKAQPTLKWEVDVFAIFSENSETESLLSRWTSNACFDGVGFQQS